MIQDCFLAEIEFIGKSWVILQRTSIQNFTICWPNINSYKLLWQRLQYHAWPVTSLTERFRCMVGREYPRIHRCDFCFSYSFLKLINYSCADDPISLHQLSQVHVFWYPMKILIKTHSISSKTDQDTDQETWILISLNTKYSIFAASIIT